MSSLPPGVRCCGRRHALSIKRYVFYIFEKTTIFLFINSFWLYSLSCPFLVVNITSSSSHCLSIRYFTHPESQSVWSNRYFTPTALKSLKKKTRQSLLKTPHFVRGYLLIQITIMPSLGFWTLGTYSHTLLGCS